MLHTVNENAVRTILSGTDVSHLTSDVLNRDSILNHHHIVIIYSCKTGNVLANGTNHPLPHGSIHAEIDALHRLNARLRDKVLPLKEFRKGVGVISLRISQQGKLRLAKPCPACDRALRSCILVKRIEWSDQCGSVKCEKS